MMEEVILDPPFYGERPVFFGELAPFLFSSLFGWIFFIQTPKGSVKKTI